MARPKIKKIARKAIVLLVLLLVAVSNGLYAEAEAGREKQVVQGVVQGEVQGGLSVALLAQAAEQEVAQEVAQEVEQEVAQEVEQEKKSQKTQDKDKEKSFVERARARAIAWVQRLKNFLQNFLRNPLQNFLPNFLQNPWENSQLLQPLRSLIPAREPPSNLSGDYLALGHAEFVQDFSRASEIATRLTAHMEPKQALQQVSQQVLQRAMLAHLRAGDIDQALAIAKKFKNKKNTHGFIAKFLLATRQMREGKPEKARRTIGDLSGFGDFVRYSAPVFRFWIAYAVNDTRGEAAALREIEQESLENFAQLLRLYAALARGEKKEMQQILRRGADSGNGFSFVWAQALYHAKSSEKETALAILSPFKNKLRASSLFLDELHRRIESGEEIQLLPSKEKDKATFFLARSLADLASSERSLGVKLLLARIAVEAEPTSAYAKMLLIEALSDYKQYDEALLVSAQIGEESIYRRQSLLQQAEILRKQAQLQQSEPLLDKFQQAIDILKNMQAQTEDEVLAWWYLGSFYRVADMHEKAVPFFDKAVKIYKKKSKDFAENKKNSYWMLFYERGIALERTGKWAQAEKDFLEALELSPEQPMVMNYLAYTWLDLEDDERYEQALEMLKQAISLRQGSGAVADSLGWAYYKLEEYQEALEELEKAITFDPEDPTINDHLGDVYWKVGRLIEARYQWARVLAFENKDKELLKSAQQKLENGLLK